MNPLVLAPGLGIGPIKLGAARADVRTAMCGVGLALASESKSTDHFSGASIQVGYEDDDTVSFIGVSSNADVALLYCGTDLFDIEAEKVFDLLAARDNSGPHEYSRFEYVFPSQIVTLYEADQQYDRKRGEARAIWGQIGCGDERYKQAIIKIHGGVLNRPPVKK